MKNGLIIEEYGTKRYYLNDKIHREDGPAIECYDGSKWYYLNDNLHREDGPAIVSGSGTEYYYLNDKYFFEEEYWKEIENRKSLKDILSKIKNDQKKPSKKCIKKQIFFCSLLYLLQRTNSKSENDKKVEINQLKEKKESSKLVDHVINN